MRPVRRGVKPAGLTIKRYSDAWEPLKNALGEYCSYCEKPLTDVIEIEHVKPKKIFPNEAIKWDNLLIGCRFCNAIKGTRPTDDLELYIWPHLENPLLLIGYAAQAPPFPRDGIGESSFQRVLRTISLVGLDRNGVSNPRASKTDNRWVKRDEAFVIARNIRSDLEAKPALMQVEEYAKVLRLVIEKTGFCSVWWTVFEGFAAVRLMALDAFPGTDRDRFDAEGEALT